MDRCCSPKRRNLAIKLFGRKIPLSASQSPAKPISYEVVEAVKKPKLSLGLSDAIEEQKVSREPNGPKEEQREADGTEEHEKAFKKPEKILPCPRCNSLDTKFCYFNNYNVNQPRHFCKNCQRYWTAGGTMRNVPIGAGRRKNKQFASQYRQILVAADGNYPISTIETTESTQNQIDSWGKNGMVLKFGSKSPICGSTDTMLQLGFQKTLTASSIHEQEIPSCYSPSTEMANSMIKEQAFYSVHPWSFPLNQENMNRVQFCAAPMVAITCGSFPQSIPVQFLPSSHIALQNPSTSASNGNYSQCGTPGKYWRDNAQENYKGNYILVPKTLKLDETDSTLKSRV